MSSEYTSNKIPNLCSIFRMMVAISHGMHGALGYKYRFLAFFLCLIKRAKHTIRHELVLVAMYEKHWFYAPSNLFYLLRLRE